MAGPRLSSPTGCDPTRPRCGNSAICTAAKWVDGRTTGLKIHTCHSDDESGRCSDFVARQHYKNSSRSTLRFTTISTRNAISSIVKLARSDARLRQPGGSRLRLEVGHFRPSCAKRKRVAIRLTASLGVLAHRVDHHMGRFGTDRHGLCGKADSQHRLERKTKHNGNSCAIILRRRTIRTQAPDTLQPGNGGTR